MYELAQNKLITPEGFEPKILKESKPLSPKPPRPDRETCMVPYVPL